MTRRCARSTRSTRRRRLDRAPAARRNRAFARRGATIETRRRVGRTRTASHRARSNHRIDGWTPSTSRPRLARSRRRSPDRGVARTRRRRVSPARDARASGRLGARREGGAREERERKRESDGTARANDARGRGSASATSRDANFFLCARRVTRPRRRAGTVARRERECEWCDFELVCSIAIVRRARRCASPPRARL